MFCSKEEKLNTTKMLYWEQQRSNISNILCCKEQWSKITKMLFTQKKQRSDVTEILRSK